MRQNTNARTIRVNKADLIKKIQENKTNHVKDYNEAIVAYRQEAEKQLNEQLTELGKGSLKIRLNLTQPVDARDEYDKILQVFQWEVDDIIELSQGEFNEYVLDETPNIIMAKLQNSAYKSKSL